MIRLLMMAAGGTGGHMFPAQALAEAMLARGWRVQLTTDERGTRYVGGFPHAGEIIKLPSATFARGGLASGGFSPWAAASAGVVLSHTLHRLRRADAQQVQAIGNDLAHRLACSGYPQ